MDSIRAHHDRSRGAGPRVFPNRHSQPPPGRPRHERLSSDRHRRRLGLFDSYPHRLGTFTGRYPTCVFRGRRRDRHLDPHRPLP